MDKILRQIVQFEVQSLCDTSAISVGSSFISDHTYTSYHIPGTTDHVAIFISIVWD
jgi:hypothetical protein